MPIDSVKDHSPPVSVKPDHENFSKNNPDLGKKISAIFDSRELTDQPPEETLASLASLELSSDTSLTSPQPDTAPSVFDDSQDQAEIAQLNQEIKNLNPSDPETSSTVAPEQPVSFQTIVQETPLSKIKFISKIKNIYVRRTQQKVDQYKNLMVSDPNYKMPPRLSPMKYPSTLKEFGRLTLDTKFAKILFPKLYRASQLRQNSEAERIAAIQYSIYLEELADAQLKQRQTEESNRRQEEIIKVAEAKRREQQQFEQDFLTGMETHRQKKREGFRKQRVQEILEKLFNKKLTKLEDIDLDSSIEGSGVVKRESDGVLFYDMKGYQFRFLQHGINYKSHSDGELIGSKTSRELISNPSLWERTRASIGQTGGQEASSKSNIIATSYINTETNLNGWGRNLICYGFDHISPSSLIASLPGDGGTPTHIEDGVINLIINPDFLGTPEYIETGKSFYTEVDLKRYDSNGKPKLPRFLVVRDWVGQSPKTKEVFLRHAKHFNIPIINIETQFYKLKKAD